MINRISFSNYKAFESGEFELSPITLLIGANSAGKSSILQLILLFAQSFQSADDYVGAFKLNGKYVSLGEGLNIFREKKQGNELFVRFDFPEVNYFVNDKIAEAVQEYAFVLSRWGEDECFTEMYKLSEEAKQDPELFVSLIDKLKGMVKKYGTLKKDMGRFLSRNNLIDLSDVASMCGGMIGGVNITGVGYTFFYDEKAGEVHVKKIQVYSAEKELIGYSVRRDNGYKVSDLSSDFFSRVVLDRCRVAFGRERKIDGFKLVSIVPKKRRHFTAPSVITSVGDMLEDIFEISCNSVSSSFKGGLVNHVSPLRAFPQRYYMIDQSYTRESLNTKEGDSLADALKRNPDIKRSVNNWLNKFNLNVDVEALKDIIHSIKIKQNNLHLDLTDVGFGISQVLPVIVQGFLSKPSSITIIEQPEIHLHPKMQAELADLFIDIINTSKKSLVVETHSEALLKRLRRRISEGVISSRDVSIYFVHGKDRENSAAYLRKIEVDSKGAFEWPRDFTETEIEDTIEFMKNQ